MAADWSKREVARRFEEAATECFLLSARSSHRDHLIWAQRVFSIWATGNPDYIVQLEADDLIAAAMILSSERKGSRV